jgi:probable phosphoglycerate mutase
MTTPRRVRAIDLDNPFPTSLEGMCELLLVRHGEQKFWSNITLGEALDAPLSELGQEQARVLGERLAGTPIDAVYCSSMKRAHATAEAVARHHGLAPSIVDDMREIDLWHHAPQDKGLLDIYSRSELAEIYREIRRARSHKAYPHVEDVDAFRARIIGAIDVIAEDNAGKRVVVACHGGVINTYLSHLFGSPYDALVTVHHTSITVVRAADVRRAVLTVNDYAHVHEVQSERGDINA